MNSKETNALPWKIKLPNMDSMKTLSRNLTPPLKRSFVAKYGDILDLLFVNVQPEAISVLAQFYDPPTRSFLFKDFQLAPTLEEFEGILGIPQENKGPYVEIGSLPEMKDLARALDIDVRNLADNFKKRRDNVQGFLSAYFEEKARERATLQH